MCFYENYFYFRKCCHDVLVIKYAFRAKSVGTLHISHIFFWLTFLPEKEKKEFQGEEERAVSNMFMGI